MKRKIMMSITIILLIVLIAVVLVWVYERSQAQLLKDEKIKNSCNYKTVMLY